MLGVRKRNIDDLRSQLFVPSHGGAHGLLNLGVETFDEIFLGQTQREIFYSFVEIGRVIRNCLIQRR
jgi:hypothetical protein